MIEFVFTVDYEIFGNGEGSLENLVLEPAERLRAAFDWRGARFVVFPDIIEFERMEAAGADPAISRVRAQLRDLYRKGYEIGLHIHPWWQDARLEKGRWVLDASRYNLCAQEPESVGRLLDLAIGHLRDLLADPAFTPVSFRAGHLLFQPTQPLAGALAARGLKIDSSVYPGGLWRRQGQDYRAAPRGARSWRFTDDVTQPEPAGILTEIPIYTRLVPVWRFFTGRRLGQQAAGLGARRLGRRIFARLRDAARVLYPVKFDVGQMDGEDIERMMRHILDEDRKDPSDFHPVVAILHTKDRAEGRLVDGLLDELAERRIPVSTLCEVLGRIDSLGAGGPRT
jgi:hypothetical protein